MKKFNKKVIKHNNVELQKKLKEVFGSREYKSQKQEYNLEYAEPKS